MIKHNMCNTRIYNIWRGITQRCYNKNKEIYSYYGGRGITMCEEWRGDNGFINFYNWSINNGYSEKLSIDRIDNNGNYEPSNCRWSDHSTQMANRRNTGKTEYIGVYKHSNGSCFVASVMHNKKVIFNYTNRSKNDCALKRNEFIKEAGLDYPLNEIKEEFEEICIHKRPEYIAYSKETNNEICRGSEKYIAKELGISSSFIWQCLKGDRNSRKYIFKKVGVV